MRTLPCIAILLFAAPALASGAQPDSPPSPPSVTYEVWGFKWDGRRYEKQANYSFTTTDIKKAAIYADQVNGYAGWSATTNIPEPCVVHTVYRGPAITGSTAISIARQTDLRGLGLHAERREMGQGREVFVDHARPGSRLGATRRQSTPFPAGGPRTTAPSRCRRRNDMSIGGTVHGAELLLELRPPPSDHDWRVDHLSARAAAFQGAVNSSGSAQSDIVRQLTKLRHLEQRPRHDQHAKYDQHSKYDQHADDEQQHSRYDQHSEHDRYPKRSRCENNP